MCGADGECWCRGIGGKNRFLCLVWIWLPHFDIVLVVLLPTAAANAIAVDVAVVKIISSAWSFHSILCFAYIKNDAIVLQDVRSLLFLFFSHYTSSSGLLYVFLVEFIHALLLLLVICVCVYANNPKVIFVECSVCSVKMELLLIIADLYAKSFISLWLFHFFCTLANFPMNEEKWQHYL